MKGRGERMQGRDWQGAGACNLDSNLEHQKGTANKLTSRRMGATRSISSPAPHITPCCHNAGCTLFTRTKSRVYRHSQRGLSFSQSQQLKLWPHYAAVWPRPRTIRPTTARSGRPGRPGSLSPAYTARYPAFISGLASHHRRPPSAFAQPRPGFASYPDTFSVAAAALAPVFHTSLSLPV